MKKITILMLTLLATLVNADVIYLSPKGNDNNNGKSWQSAVKTLPTAIRRAQDGDDIYVQQGTYKVTNEIIVSKSLSIYGGFSGTEKSHEHRKNFDAKTIFSGSGKSRIFILDNGIEDYKYGGNYNDNSKPAKDFLVDRITFSNGLKKAKESEDHHYSDYLFSTQSSGGAIYSFSYNLTIQNCVFSSNKIQASGDVDARGGAVAIYNPDNNGNTLSLEIKDSTFEKNSVTGSDCEGGAIYIGTGIETYIDGTDFIKNSVSSSYVKDDDKYEAEAEGGAISVASGSSFQLYYSKFESNSVSCPAAKKNAEYSARGGAISFDDIPYKDQRYISGCDFKKNSAKGGYSIGGAIYGHNVFISVSVFESNSAAVAGGGIATQYSIGYIDSCHFKLNTAKFGGAFASLPNSLPIACYSDLYDVSSYNTTIACVENIGNCFFEQNKATVSGGAIYCSQSLIIDHHTFGYNTESIKQVLSLTHSSFYKNAASLDGAAIAFASSEEAFPSKETILGVNNNVKPEVNVYRSTFYQNSISGKNGYGATLSLRNPQDVYITDSIFWENTSKNTKYPVDINAKGENVAVYNSIVQKEQDIFYDCKIEDPLILGIVDLDYRMYCLATSKYGPTFDVEPIMGACLSACELKIREPESAEKECIVKVREGDKHTFYVNHEIKEHGKYSYLWQVSSDGGKTWKNAGSKKDSLTVKCSDKLHNNQYRCKVSCTASKDSIEFSDPDNNYFKIPAGYTFSDYSIPETLYVVCKTKIVAQPVSCSGYEEETASFKIKAVGEGLTYEWFILTEKVGKNESWSCVGDSDTLNVDVQSVGEGKKTYKCTVRDANGFEISSKSVQLTPVARPRVNSIVVKQVNELTPNDSYDNSEHYTAYTEFPVEIKVSATGKSIKYQWYKSIDGGDIYNEIPKATKATYKFTPNESDMYTSYKCKVYNKDGLYDESKTIYFYFEQPPMPASLENHRIDIYEIEYNATEDHQYFGIATSKTAMYYGELHQDMWTGTTYSYKRISPTKAVFTIKSKVRGEYSKNLSCKLDIKYDEESCSYYGDDSNYSNKYTRSFFKKGENRIEITKYQDYTPFNSLTNKSLTFAIPSLYYDNYTATFDSYDSEYMDITFYNGYWEANVLNNYDMSNGKWSLKSISKNVMNFNFSINYPYQTISAKVTKLIWKNEYEGVYWLEIDNKVYLGEFYCY